MVLYTVILTIAILALAVRLTRRMRNVMARAAVVISITLIGGVVSFVFVALATFSFEEPEIEARIDDEFYFTHQQYGGATVSTDGQQLVFYKEKALWPDKRIGQINCVYCSEYVDVRLIRRPGDSIAIVLIDNKADFLDTAIVSMQSGFDFSVYAPRIAASREDDSVTVLVGSKLR